MTQTCENNCNHRDQLTSYPLEATVRSTAEIFSLAGIIPAGTRGRIKAHCDDGRAYVFFDGFEGGHTFHDPSTCLRVESSQTTQPAPDPGEWRVEAYRVAAGESIGFAVYGADKVLKARTYLESTAEEIAANHNAIPKLVAALEDESLPRPDGLCWCDDEYNPQRPHVKRCQDIRDLINTVRAGGE